MSYSWSRALGVGYDSVNVPACSAADVLVTITVGAVDRPVAEATIGWMLALSHNLRIKDQLVRTGQWDERSRHNTSPHGRVARRL